jgi:hypothetical protein
MPDDTISEYACPNDTVLVFCRNYLVEDFRLNVAPLRDDWRFIFASDGPGDVDADTRADFYACLKVPPAKALFAPELVEQMRLRCRLLRNIDPGQAHRRIHANSHAMLRLLDRFNPAVVLCHMVDEYIIDGLSQLCKQRGITFIGYCGSFFPDRVQVTAFSNGAAFDVVGVDDAEIAAVQTRLAEDKFRQSYIQAPSLRFRDHLRGYLRYQIKRVVFPIKGWLERSPLAVHYEILPYIAEHRRLLDFPKSAMFERDWLSTLTQARKGGLTVLYVPLSYAPESTNDYWISNLKAVYYERMILDLIRRAAQNHVVVVKEHVHMIGCRARTFFAALRAIPGVINVHPTEFSNLVLSHCDMLVLGGGSSGVEATLRNKPVLSYCETSYWFKASGAGWLDLDRLDDLDQVVSTTRARHQPMTDPQKHEFLRCCMASTVALQGYGKRWPLVAPEDMRAVLRKAISA